MVEKLHESMVRLAKLTRRLLRMRKFDRTKEGDGRTTRRDDGFARETDRQLSMALQRGEEETESDLATGNPKRKRRGLPFAGGHLKKKPH
ncbi:UNVERIFIED_CONTAM: hypothetical protein HHA_450590 [Hammondia hammondi]|eukprot:XP_008882906.1 hypothetical protein HHA_450590 [Hammondia hammondi]